MDYKIAMLEAGINKLLKDSEIPPTVKKLILKNALHEIELQSAAAIDEQLKEVKKRNAESA